MHGAVYSLRTTANKIEHRAYPTMEVDRRQSDKNQLLSLSLIFTAPYGFVRGCSAAALVRLLATGVALLMVVGGLMCGVAASTGSLMDFGTITGRSGCLPAASAKGVASFNGWLVLLGGRTTISVPLRWAGFWLPG